MNQVGDRIHQRIDGIMENNERRWSEEMAQYKIILNESDQCRLVCEKFKGFMQETDVNVRGFEKKIDHLLDLCVEAVTGLKTVEKWDKRIDEVNENIRLVRNLTDQSIEDNNKKFKTVVQ